MKIRSSTLSIFGVVTGIALLIASLIKDPLHPAFHDRPVQALAAILLGLALALLPMFQSMRERLARALFESNARGFNAFLFCAGAVLTACISRLVFNGLPHLDDGVASIFQARIFAAGHVVLPLPANSEFFECFGVLGSAAQVGHWCGMYPPGWPALLVPGVWLGATWLVNPVLHGFLCVSIAMLGRELYGDRVGRLAGALGLASPLLLIYGGEHLSHTSTALFLCLCAWSTCRLLRAGSTRYGLAAGLCWGVAFLCRPLTAVVVGACIGLRALVEWRGALRVWRGLACALLLAAGSTGVLAHFHDATTGDAGTPGHKAGMGPRSRMGFGKIDHVRSHPPAQGVEWTLRRLRNINHHLLGWPVPFYVLALWPFLRGRARGNEFWLLFPSLGLLGVYAAFWYYERYFPSRYISEGMPMLLILAARALRGESADARAPAWSAPLLGAGLSFLAFASGPHFLERFHKNYGYVESVLPRVVEHYGISNAVVFMETTGTGDPQHDPRSNFYATGFMRNNFDLTGSVIYARNLKGDNYRLMSRYVGRDCYLYRFDRATLRAQLYRMHYHDRSYTLTPIAPTESELLEAAPPL